jgi:hypothetical protein
MQSFNLSFLFKGTLFSIPSSVLNGENVIPQVPKILPNFFVSVIESFP